MNPVLSATLGLLAGIILIGIGVVVTLILRRGERGYSKELKRTDDDIQKDEEEGKSFRATLATIQADIHLMQTQIAVLTTQMSPLWSSVQSKIIAELHHPSKQFKEMDILMEQLEQLKITSDGTKRLKVLLLERSVDTSPEVSAEERASAILLLSVMDKVIDEAARVAIRVTKDNMRREAERWVRPGQSTEERVTHLEENNQAIGEVLTEQSPVPPNPKTQKRQSKKPGEGSKRD